MSLDTLQQRIHRASEEVDLDALYTETEDYYNNNQLTYNFALGLVRELNKRLWLAQKEETLHYPFFSAGGGGPTWDSNSITWDSDVYTFDAT